MLKNYVVAFRKDYDCPSECVRYEPVAAESVADVENQLIKNIDYGGVEILGVYGEL